jgi:CysZ protein
MIASAAQALGQMFDRSFRGVLWLGIGCTLGLFILLFFVLQWAVGHLPDFGYVWLQDAIKIIAGALITVVFVFLGAPIAQLFASIFLDRVATAVESRYYPSIARGQGAGFTGGLIAGLTFTAVSLVLNLLALPLHFALPLIGTIVVLLINGYLTGRTYFELAALRHVKAAEARALRRNHRLRLFLGGALISFLAMIPFVNFIVPVFAAAMMTHEYQKLARG